MFKKKNNIFGKYPCNDYLNNALRFLLRNGEGDRELAIEEIVYAIRKADGYLCDDVKEKILEEIPGYLSKKAHFDLVFRRIVPEEK